MHALKIFDITFKKSIDGVFVLGEGRVIDAFSVVGDHARVFRVDELNETVNKVPEIGKKLRIVLGDEIFPDELGITGLRARR